MNYHFTPESRVDFYLGAFAGVFSYDSVTFRLPDIDRELKINFDDQFSYGLNAGLDIPFTADSPWIITVAVKYLISDLKEDGGPREIAIDPIIGSIGIGYKF
ncbi:MAG: OmpW family outer membrane protein [Thermoanaerobaculia bacterium]